MSPLGNRHSLLAFATCLSPAFILASPLVAPGIEAKGLSRRDNSAKIPCGNAPNIIAGKPVAAADIVIPSQDDGPPRATTDPSGYFPYLWCGAGSSTYVFIDPIGSYGFNKGTNAPIFWTGLDGAFNATQNIMKSRAKSETNPEIGDGSIDGPHTTSLDWLTPVATISGNSGIQYVEVYAQDSKHGKLTWGVYGAALAIMKDFVLSYPLYADASYFQINDGKWGTVGVGYVGVVLQANLTSHTCYLKGNPATNTGVSCSIPSDYPDA